MKKAISHARISHIFLFSSLVKENHKKMTSLELQAKKLEQKLTKADGEDEKVLLEKEIRSTEAKMAKSSLIVVVFLPWRSRLIYTITPRATGVTSS